MISQDLYQKYAHDPAAFRKGLTIEVDGSAKKFGKVMDPWQQEDFEALDPGLLLCVGRSKKARAKLRAYLERPRGHSKTTDIAVTVVWLLVFAARPLKGYSYAADRDQASLLRDAINSIVRLNPWIGEILSVDKDKVANVAKKHPGRDSLLKIETSDVGSSYGILPDFIVADEFTHWAGDGSLWNSLISSAAKKANCLLLGISNAGFVDSWQWNIREIIRNDPGWLFSRLDGPQASWMTEDRLDEQRRMLPNVAYLRLWENQWSSGGGDALTEELINAAFKDDVQPMSGTAKELRAWSFVTGVDLGLKRDCSAAVTLAIGRHGTSNQGRIRLADHKLWKPPKGGKIDLSDVENYVRFLDQTFQLECVAFDPWNCELLASRIERDKKARNERKLVYDDEPFMREIPPTGSNLRDIASLVIESFTDRRFQLYECAPLRNDLHKLRVEEKGYGYRLTSPRDGDGHGDTFSAFSLALYVGHDLAGKKPIIVGGLDLDGDDPFKAAIRSLKTEQRLYAQEQADADSDDTQEPIRDLMKIMGRN